MHTTPLSARTIAPPSRKNSPLLSLTAVAVSPAARCATEACKTPSLDGLWIYGVTLSLGRICYSYRKKYAFWPWPTLATTNTMFRLLRPLAFAWPNSHSYYAHTDTRVDRAHSLELVLRQSRCGG